KIFRCEIVPKNTKLFLRIETYEKDDFHFHRAPLLQHTHPLRLSRDLSKTELLRSQTRHKNRSTSTTDQLCGFARQLKQYFRCPPSTHSHAEMSSDQLHKESMESFSGFSTFSVVLIAK